MKTEITKFTYSVSLMLNIVQTLGTVDRFDINEKLLKNGQKNNCVEVSIDTMIEILALIAEIDDKKIRLSLTKKLGLC